MYIAGKVKNNRTPQDDEADMMQADMMVINVLTACLKRRLEM